MDNALPEKAPTIILVDGCNELLDVGRLISELGYEARGLLELNEIEQHDFLHGCIVVDPERLSGEIT